MTASDVSEPRQQQVVVDVALLSLIADLIDSRKKEYRRRNISF